MKNVVLSAVAALLFSASVQAQSTVDSIAAKYKLIPMPAPLTIEKTFPVLGTYQLNTPITDPNATVSSTDNASASAGSTTITADASTGTTTTTATDATASGAMDATAVGNVTITLDSVNKGIVWVDGLPEGRMKAYLQKSPGTYRIVSYKTEDDKATPEGTLLLDTTSNTLNIALGKAYDEVDPASVFAVQDAATTTDGEVDAKAKTSKSKSDKAKAKEKKKVTFYTATKVMPATDATATPADATQQQSTQPAPATDSTNQNQSQQPAQSNSNQ